MGLFDKIKQGVESAKALPEQMAALQQQAQVYQAAQGYGPDGQPLPPDQRPVLDPTAFLPPPSPFVKRQKCGTCGAPKQLVSVREYLYCDYCGALLDFDLRQASANAMVNPDATAYAMEANKIGPAAAKAQGAGDRDLYRSLQGQLFDLQTRYTKWAVPPRAWNDERYRQGWVRFQTECAVATAFDPECVRLEDAMKRKALGLRWKAFNPLKMAMASMGGGQSADAVPKVEPSSLWALVDVLLERGHRTEQVVTAAGLRELDPDRSPAVVADRMMRSAIAQGYLKHLEDDSALVELIDRLGITREYIRPEIAGDARNCGGCGATMSCVPGAGCVVCDGCGRRVAVGAGELPCTTCGAKITLPEDAHATPCPYCRTEVRRV